MKEALTTLTLSFLLASSLLVGAATPSPQLLAKIRLAAERADLDPLLLESVIEAESNFNALATSHKGAMGLMQVMPNTADECEVHNPYNPLNNLMGASICLRLRINHFKGNLPEALASYNAGIAAVERHGGIPPYKETRNYVKKVTKRYQERQAKRLKQSLN